MNQDYDVDLALFINGSWRTGEGRDVFPVMNPATGKAIAELPVATENDLQEALAAAEKGFAQWRATDVDARAAVLHKAAALVRERAEALAILLTMEQGKPLAESRTEILSCATVFDYCAEEAKRSYGRVALRPPGQRAMVLKQPVGPVASLTPWNFPASLMSKKVAAALATGCSVIAKPAEETPGSTSGIIRCLADAGVPAGVVQLVFGVPDMVSRQLLASPVIRKLSFTGSTVVGTHLMKLAADGLKRVTMELGGHAPVLVFDDCNLEKTLDIVVTQKFRNAGQVCISPTRFYVQEGVYDRFVAGFNERTGKVRVGNGLEAETVMGPLANPRRPQAVGVLIEDAIAKGARVGIGGSTDAHSDFRDKGFFFRPTVLSDVPLEADIMSQEPFGPVALIRPFKTFEEAIEQANRLPFGLASFVHTENGRTANMAGDLIEAGMVGINTAAISAADMPFGGVKHSGFGSEGGPEGLESYYVTKAIHQT
ncbi:MAG: NAD-dependent succinate-semialdehyde dehydrogenase [Sphingorhabdus sp.]